MGINTISLIWAFIESTIFFVVPDVWLTVLAKDNLKAGLDNIISYIVNSTNKQKALVDF